MLRIQDDRPGLVPDNRNLHPIIGDHRYRHRGTRIALSLRVVSLSIGVFLLFRCDVVIHFGDLFPFRRKLH
jgi:hypothetical protein